MTTADKTGTTRVDKNIASPQTLGFTRAEDIVCKAANTIPANLSRTLAELGVDGISFQGTAFNGVSKAGYSIDIDSIPNSPSTTLFAAAAVIQNATLAD